MAIPFVDFIIARTATKRWWKNCKGWEHEHELSGNMHMVPANKLIGVGVKMAKFCLFCGGRQVHIPFALPPIDCF